MSGWNMIGRAVGATQILTVPTTTRTISRTRCRRFTSTSSRWNSTSTKDSSTKVDSPSLSVRETLLLMGELQARVSEENSKVTKAKIIAEYPQLRSLLEFVYDPQLRLNLSSATLHKASSPKPSSQISFLSSQPMETYLDAQPPPQNLLELFELLSARKVTGNAAKGLVLSFLAHHRVLQDGTVDIFDRLLDRNLAAGFGARTLLSVAWPGDSSSKTTPHAPSSDSRSRLAELVRDTTAPYLPSRPPSTPPGSSLSQFTPSTTVSNLESSAPSQALDAHTDQGALSYLTIFSDKKTGSISAGLSAFSVALGKSIEPPFRELEKSKQNDPQLKWYASRKLDGLRVLSLLDFLVPSTRDQSLQIADVTFVSRTGNPFTSLAELEKQLVQLVSFPQLREWLDRDSKGIREQDGGVVKRLVLDGEACLMRPKRPDEKSEVYIPSEDSPESALWQHDDDLVEDFNAAVSALRRSLPALHPAYYLFDVLSWCEVEQKEASTAPGLGKTFGARIEDGKQLAAWLEGELERQGVREKMLRMLPQWEVKSVSEVEGMVERAGKEQWEGLIIRADKPYKGKRSTDIRKFKKWQDAEYKVESLETNRMRLAINGVFEERIAMANIWISHKGHPVSVGSGFTAEQRLRFAERPEDIIGKEVTVQYFAESQAEDRGKEVSSLRFPRVKHIWGDRRDV